MEVSDEKTESNYDNIHVDFFISDSNPASASYNIYEKMDALPVNPDSIIVAENTLAYGNVEAENNIALAKEVNEEFLTDNNEDVDYSYIHPQIAVSPSNDGSENDYY